ncbi:fibronectin type III domain-containing protein [Bacillus thuringiensis]|uniref:fibronectin type III domain-containing protein n=1 Tax=Bacillus thuringiensis TaxID=1428 RepID=UPI000BF9429D|nr:fibronectin type III domain-containing protein [Bacillus thuringiensis]PEV70065.1 chitinase [Bacillus thuringiensis]PGK63321.1 chitinase [Bacillus thuringiensis]PGO84732.1 chitinase [Bacillus thuringiensis]
MIIKKHPFCTLAKTAVALTMIIPTSQTISHTFAYAQENIAKSQQQVAPFWNKNKDYPGESYVTYEGKIYHSVYWVNAGTLPTQQFSGWELYTGSEYIPDNSDPNDLFGEGITWPTHVFAPYVDNGMNPQNLLKYAQETNTSFFTLSFIVADKNGNPVWGGSHTPIGDGNLDDQIKQIRKIGGDVKVSFGGANAGNIPGLGADLAAAITDVNKLKDAYKSVINTLHLTHMDFDIEGVLVAHPESIERRSKAITLLQKELKAEGKDVKIGYTLPVMPYGLTNDGINVIQSAIKHDVDLNSVNIMTMDYGQQNQQMGQAAIDAINSLHGQLTNLYKGTIKDSDIWKMIAVTPMIGKNDTQNETFTLNNAKELFQFAKEKGIGEISMWSVYRDKKATESWQIGQATGDASGLPDVEDGAFSKLFSTFNSNTEIDVIAPTAPSNLRSVSQTTTTVELQWEASTDNIGVKEYEVYRDGKKVGTTKTTHYEDTGLQANTKYNFTIIAADAAGNKSKSSNEVSVTTKEENPEQTAPTAPTGLQASETTTNSVHLIWEESISNVGIKEYEIYRNGTKIATSPSTYYTDESLLASTEYRYMVKAIDTQGKVSVASNEIKITTKDTPSSEYKTWDSYAAYKKGDRVEHQGKIYEAVQSYQGYGDPNWIFSLALWKVIK